jgi:hypothetical protein
VTNGVEEDFTGLEGISEFPEFVHPRQIFESPTSDGASDSNNDEDG